MPRQWITSCARTAKLSPGSPWARGPPWTSHLHRAFWSEEPTAALVGAQRREEKHTENDIVAINIFIGRLLYKAEGEYYSSRIHIFNKKSARRGDFSASLIILLLIYWVIETWNYRNQCVCESHCHLVNYVLPAAWGSTLCSVQPNVFQPEFFIVMGLM